MKDQDCIQFLQWSLPRLRMRWPGFRKVRGQVCKRITGRLHELSLGDVKAYRSYLDNHPQEWPALDSLCNITISRFYRDRAVFQFLQEEALPTLAKTAIERRDKKLRVWSVGCASGEEPYTIALIWNLAVGGRFPDLALEILATDVDRAVVERAQRGCYPSNSLKDLPADWAAGSFIRDDSGRFCLRQEDRRNIQFLAQDIRRNAAHGLFHLILCRNLAFTYFEEPLQREVLLRLHSSIITGGILVIGIHESLPSGFTGFEPYGGVPGIYRKE